MRVAENCPLQPDTQGTTSTKQSKLARTRSANSEETNESCEAVTIKGFLREGEHKSGEA